MAPEQEGCPAAELIATPRQRFTAGQTSRPVHMLRNPPHDGTIHSIVRFLKCVIKKACRIVNPVQSGAKSFFTACQFTQIPV